MVNLSNMSQKPSLRLLIEVSNRIAIIIMVIILAATTVHAEAKHLSATTDEMISLPMTQMLIAYEGFQNDADIIRLEHLRYWTNRVEDYHNKTGKYPFQGESTVPIYVFVATSQQQKYITQPPPAPAIARSMKDFVKILETSLGKPINEYYDPQYAPDAKPNFYMYMIDGDTYHFAIHTHQKYLFSKRVATNYYKVEVSNEPNYGVDLILLPDNLFNTSHYMKAVNKAIQKPEFFDKRITLTLHATKE